MGAGLKPRIVLSGVNFTDMGPLAVFRDAIASLASIYSDDYDIVALVHKSSLFDTPGVKFIEFPEIKSSWLRRLLFEYHQCSRMSEQLNPHLWFAMHDMTPNVRADIKAVYCHNPSPFYKFRLNEGLLDWKFGLFTLLYRFLYPINIRSNNFVVVQQDWMRAEFQRRYGVRSVVVAHPSVEILKVPIQGDTPSSRAARYRFFYPAYPRTFKNVEQILKAARRLENHGFKEFEVWLTSDGSETRYAKKMTDEFSDLTTVKWLGLLPRGEVMRLYRESDCLVFPSKLETWGMPITEFKTTGKPILAANLPYARETVGGYSSAAFFDVNSEIELASIMKEVATGSYVFEPATEAPIVQPFSRNWEELWEILLGRVQSSANNSCAGQSKTER